MFGLLKRASAPVFDETEGNPLVAPALRLFLAHDWRGLVALYDDLAPSDRCHLVNRLGLVLRLEHPLPDEGMTGGADAQAGGASVAVVDDDIGTLKAICAGLWVVRAWRYRGAGYADTVAGDASERMRHCLWRADDLLTDSRDDATVDAWRFRIAMGLEVSGEEVEQIADRYFRLPTQNIFAAYTHMMCWSPKWGGSLDDMWRTAYDHVEGGPNSCWRAVIISAMIEEWLWETEMVDVAIREWTYKRKMRERSYTEDVRRIDDAFWAGYNCDRASPAERSFAHNHFAFMFWLLRDFERASVHLKAMDRAVMEYPWSYQAPRNVLALVSKARRKASLPALPIGGDAVDFEG